MIPAHCVHVTILSAQCTTSLMWVEPQHFPGWIWKSLHCDMLQFQNGLRECCHSLNVFQSGSGNDWNACFSILSLLTPITPVSISKKPAQSALGVKHLRCWLLVKPWRFPACALAPEDSHQTKPNQTKLRMVNGVINVSWGTGTAFPLLDKTKHK